MRIRSFDVSDTVAVVDLSLRAWAPVHISIREALGPEINDALQPDWRAMQQRDVEEVLSAPTSNVWVADADAIVAGFVAVRIHDDRRIGEIDMLAVDPSRQGTGIGTALTTARSFEDGAPPREWYRALTVPRRRREQARPHRALRTAEPISEGLRT